MFRPNFIRSPGLCLLPVALMAVCVLPTVRSQQAASQTQRQPSRQKISAFEVTNDELSRVLQKLARTSQVLIGLELIPGKDNSQPGNSLSIYIADGMVCDVLNAVIAADSRYQWEEVDGVINVFPKERKNPLLEIVVQDFQAKQLCAEAATRLATDSPEVKNRTANMEMVRRDIVNLPAPSCESLPKISLNLHNVKVRRILNEILKEGGSNFWAFQIYGDRNQYFTIVI